MTTTKLKIRFYGDPCLRKKSSPVKNVGPGERLLIQAMMETMREHKGVGLAAPQVGINEQIFVADTGDGVRVFVNPKIIKKSGVASMEEGCLSIPGVVVHIKRPARITVHYLDENNKQVEQAFGDLMARVIQHEIDHLNGKLIVDYASLIQKRKLRGQLKALQQQVG